MNEKRKLIDAEALYSELRKAFAWKDLSEEQITIYEAIEAAPTVDAEPVRRGRWIPNEYGVGWWCGECKQHVRRKRNCCPECGARMDGESK